VLSRFFEKILPFSGGDFFKNPQGLTFTTFQTELFLLCFLFFGGVGALSPHLHGLFLRSSHF
jgi:hypothetical protein